MTDYRAYLTIQKILEREGWELVDMSIWDVLEYLNMCDPDYTIYDWIIDTRNNYPESLKRRDE